MPKTRKQRQRKPIKRQTRHFQLRVGEQYPVDKHVAEILDFKKSKRSEVTAIRDGVRLLWALENNDLSVLFDMFPHLKPQIASSGGGGAGGSELAKEIAAQIVLMGGTPGYVMQSALQPVTTAAPAIPAATKAPPVAVVSKAVSTITADEIADNMLNMLSMFD